MARVRMIHAYTIDSVRLRFRELNVNAVRAGLRVWLEREREDGAET